MTPNFWKHADLRDSFEYFIARKEILESEKERESMLKRANPDWKYMKGRMSNGKVYIPHMTYTTKEGKRRHVGYDRFLCEQVLDRELIPKYESYTNMDINPFNISVLTIAIIVRITEEEKHRIALLEYLSSPLKDRVERESMLQD
jgi:hypothetical protein